MANAGRLMKAFTIWRLLDGKPGHESQTLGLANAMVSLGDEHGVNVQVYDIPVKRSDFGPVAWLMKRFPPGHGAPAPDWIIAAGSSTHWALLCAKRAYGGKAVVLMKPSLPLCWFDWVIAPQHDGASGANVISTVGALNPMQPGIKKSGSVLVLVGGPSKHFDFDVDQVFQTLKELLTKYPHARITDSRRTPKILGVYLSEDFSEQYQSWDKCPPGWMAKTLAEVERVWVTEDSVSMIYESLSSGCHVGLLSLDENQKGGGRLAKGIEALIKDGYLVRLKKEAQLISSHLSAKKLNEANRVAFILMGETNK